MQISSWSCISASLRGLFVRHTSESQTFHLDQESFTRQPLYLLESSVLIVPHISLGHFVLFWNHFHDNYYLHLYVCCIRCHPSESDVFALELFTWQSFYSPAYNYAVFLCELDWKHRLYSQIANRHTEIIQLGN